MLRHVLINGSIYHTSGHTIKIDGTIIEEEGVSG